MMLTAEECRVVADRAAQCRVEWAFSYFATRETPGAFWAAAELATNPELVQEGCPAVALAAHRGDLSGNGIDRANTDIIALYGSGEDYEGDLSGAPQRVVMFFRDQAEKGEGK